ncbi:MAG: class I SAM-dependent methyltransferase, partial [Actinomycetota bacterium]
TATFHWVPDHPGLFARLAGVLRPGGRLVAQYGGRGNIASVAAVLEESGACGDAVPWRFASPEEAEAALRAAGFRECRTWLNPEATTFPSRESLAEFLRTVVLWPCLERLPEPERDACVAQVVGRLPSLVLDYVRLNIVARMPL